MEPTMTKTLQNEYARKLRVLIRRFRRDVKKWVEEQPTTETPRLQAADRELKTPDMKMSEFTEFIGRKSEAILVDSGKKVADKYTKDAFEKGGKDTDKRMGEQEANQRGKMGDLDWRAQDAIRARNLTALKRLGNDMSDDIVRTVEEGMRKGEHPRRIAERINERTEHVGIYRANMIARTETIKAYNEGAKTRYSQYGYDALKWYAARGDRTCKVCAARHNQVYKLGEEPENPAHPNCRCTWVAEDTEDLPGTEKTEKKQNKRLQERGKDTRRHIADIEGKYAEEERQLQAEYEDVAEKYGDAMSKRGEYIRRYKEEQERASDNYETPEMEELHKKINEWDDEVEKYKKQALEVQRKVDDMEKRRNEEIKDLIPVRKKPLPQGHREKMEIKKGGKKEKVSDKYITPDSWKKNNEENVEAGYDFIGRSLKKDIHPQDVRVFDIDEERPYHVDGHIWLPDGVKSRQVVHEIGHAVEYQYPDMHRQMRTFYEYRTQGEEEKKLKDVTGNPNYADWEKTRPDKFKHVYMGKIYSDNTELLSMGLEQLYSNPRKFAKDDPEMFEFVIDAIRGHGDKKLKEIGAE